MNTSTPTPRPFDNVDIWKARALRNRDRIDFLNGKTSRLLEENKTLRRDLDETRTRAGERDAIERRADLLEVALREQSKEIDRLRGIVDDRTIRDAVEIFAGAAQ